MELKVIPETGVILSDGKEALEFFKIVLENGWKKHTVNSKIIEGTFNCFPVVISCEVMMRWSDKSNIDWFGRSITLAEFKKEQGIMSMKYKAGDTLEYTLDDILVIQGIVGSVYVTLHQNGHTALMTEKDLDEENYTLKTDKPAKTDMTVSELEEKCGLPAGTLNVVAES